MKLNGIDLNKIAVFCQIVESGGYQGAAEALNVTPSALSQTVSSLEHSLGFPLFDRLGRRLVPTPRGLKLEREFRAHHSHFLAAIDELTHQGDKVAGTLRVGAYLEFAKARLTPVIRDFVRDFPEARVKMSFDSPTRLQRLLVQGDVDMCFSIFPAVEGKMISSESVYHEELVLVAPRRLLPESPTYERVMQTPMIEYYANHQPLRRWLSLHYNRRPKNIPVRIFAATAEMVLSLAREGAGIGVVPYYLVAGSDAQRDLQVIRPSPKRLTDYIWLLERFGGEKSAAHQKFRARVCEALKR